MTTTRRLLLATLAVMLTGCAGTVSREDSGPTLAEVLRSGESGTQVHWGGRIVTVRNLADRTLIEVLSLPLDSSGQPRTDLRPAGRFIVDRPGFLEPHEYAVDRLLAVRGRFNGFTRGTVGDAPYRYPVVIGEQLMLWPRDAESRSRAAGAPRINFGVGVGNHGGSVGVGVGF